MKPNIVLLVTDDHGGWAMPGVADSGVSAPNLSFLAESGATFANAYCSSPVCSPARASLYTGTIPSYHGVHDYLEDNALGADHRGIAGLPNIGTVAQSAGYTTGLFGKWHCSNFLTPHAGFDRWFTLRDGTNARFGVQRFVDQDRTIERFGHQAPYITEEAVRFVRSQTDEPWIAVINYTGTHTPHDNAPDRSVSRARRARNSGVPTSMGPKARAGFDHHVRFSWPEDAASQARVIDDYRGSVENVDDQIGILLDAVDAAGGSEQTIVIYTSDHGHMNGHFQLHTKGNATIPQNLLEPSLHVPLIIRDPVAQSGVITSPVGHCDLFQTIVSYLQETEHGRLNDNIPRPGTSLRALLTDHSQANTFPSTRFAEYGNARMIRTERWKLIARYPGPNGAFSDELYPVSADGSVDESKCLSPDHAPAEEVTQLRAELDAWFATYGRDEHDGRVPAHFAPHNSWEPWNTDPGQFPRAGA